MRARGDLPLQPIPFRGRVGGRGIERAGDRERRWLADRGAGRVLAAVEPRQDLDETDGVDVPDTGRTGQIADPGRIAGQGQDVTRGPSGCGRAS
jgi:hypothetical protein